MSGARQHKTFNTVVDIVACDGAEWVKVSTATEKRLLFDLAKAGWMGESSGSDSDEREEEEDDDADEGLLKQAKCLLKASRATRVRYRHPRIRIVLPKIRKGTTKEVDQLLDQITNMGVTLQTSEDMQAPLPLGQILPRLAGDPFQEFSKVLNIDCTILLAIVSDLSHSRVAAEDWHHKAIVRQIEMEKKDQLLPNTLWPAFGARKMLCSRQAAERMHEIVATIGTESEKYRSMLLLEGESTAHLTREERIAEFQKHSEYVVPEDWQLPIVQVECDLEDIRRWLPEIAESAMDEMSVINKSVFLYGWKEGLTTISSNRAVAKEIESAVENNRQNEEDKGPDVWLCPMARSLVGKEKTRRGVGAED